MTVRLLTTFRQTRRIVPNATFVSRRMGDVIICSATIVNMIFVGCVLGIGEHTVQSTMNALGIRRLNVSLLSDSDNS